MDSEAVKEDILLILVMESLQYNGLISTKLIVGCKSRGLEMVSPGEPQSIIVIDTPSHFNASNNYPFNRHIFVHLYQDCQMNFLLLLKLSME